MKPGFAKTLIESSLAEDDFGFYSKYQEKQFHQAITFGAYGEAGDNYYLFIYRNSNGRKVTYEGVLFIDNSFDPETPIQIMATAQNRDPHRANTFTRAALYFLENEYENTMDLTGDAENVYRGIKEVVDDWTKEEIKRKNELESYDFNVKDQEIEFRKAALKKPDNRYYAPYTIDRLKILKHDKKGAAEKAASKRSGARMGLSLLLVEGGRKVNQFRPVILPVKKDGSLGAVKAGIPSQLKKYDLGDVSELLNEYISCLNEFSKKGQKDVSRLDALNRVYFKRLADMFLEMPDELSFFQPDSRTAQFQPLKKIRFNALDLKFAPHANREHLGFYLTVTAAGGRVFTCGLEHRAIVNAENQVYLFFTADGQSYFAVPEEPGHFERLFRFLEEVERFSINDFKEVRGALMDIQSESLSIQPEPIPLYCLTFRPLPVLNIRVKDKYFDPVKSIHITFDYDSPLKHFLGEHPNIELTYYNRDKEFETKCFDLLKTDPMLKMEQERVYRRYESMETYFSLDDEDETPWLIERGRFYLEKGFKIYSEKLRRYIGNTGSWLQVDIDHGIKWLEFKPLLRNDESDETMEIDTVDLYNNTVTDKNGTLHLIKKEDVEKLIRLSKYAEQHGAVFRVPSENYFLINELYDQRMEEIPKLKEKLLWARKLEGFEKIPNYKPTRNFNGKLRNYQRTGFKWLYFLREYGLSGCLADDMGLGKTVQTLALLQTLKEEGKLTTSLLVVPVSAVPNWEAEIQRFTPKITVHRHMGADRKKDTGPWNEFDLVITSYATMRNDIEIFNQFQFDYIVLDESQNIKNYTSQVSKAAKVLRGNFRLALSGTPIENNSLELWSLFDFLMPGFLGTHRWFKKEWALPVEKHKNTEKMNMLKKMAYPFILRRKKEEVEKELPEKTEIVETLRMDDDQLELYIRIAKYYGDEVKKEIDLKGLAKSSIKILEGMLRLRQICLLPKLVNEKYAGVSSVKFDHFVDMLEDILSEGHKVLVFSQFVKVLSFIREHFDREKVTYSYIDGSVNIKNRAKTINAFQEREDTRVFLLSLKAGGVAINLTAADYVVIFDPWWNPAVEAQAIDRSHRIGQTKKVIVYRMVVKDTIEEKMILLQDQKKELVDNLITSETRAFKSLNKEDIMKLFQYS